jgi:hypothetical protein
VGSVSDFEPTGFTCIAELPAEWGKVTRFEIRNDRIVAIAENGEIMIIPYAMFKRDEAK